MKRWDRKRVVVLGIARQGKALARYLANEGAVLVMSDMKPKDQLEDVMDEWLNIETAKEFYGVVIEEIDAEACEYRINEEETAKAREALRKKGFPEGRSARQVHPLGKSIKPDWIPTEEEVQPHITISRPPGW